MKVTIKELMTEEEIESLPRWVDINIDEELRYIKLEQLRILWLFIGTPDTKKKVIPVGSLITMIWEELLKRAEEQNLEIF